MSEQNTNTPPAPPQGSGTSNPPPPNPDPGTQNPPPAPPQGTALGTAEPPKPGVIELKLPEGKTLEEPVLARYKEFASKVGLDSAKAQEGLEALIAAREAGHSSLEKQVSDNAKTQAEEWLKSSRADAEIGGAKWDTTVATASKAVERFGGQALRKVLNETGLGNHPDVIRAFYRAGQLIGEDKLNGKGDGDNKPPPPPDPDALLKKLYPTMFPKEN